MATRVDRSGDPETPTVPMAELVDAALFVTERDGIDGLSVPAVADALGVTSAAVAATVDDSDELVGLVRDHIEADVDLELDVDPGLALAWDDRIVAMVLAVDRTYSRYRGLARRVVTVEGRAPAASALRERLLDVTLAAGFPGDEAVVLDATIQLHLCGWLMAGPEAFEALDEPAVPSEPASAQRERRARGAHPALDAELDAVAARVVTPSMTPALLEVGLRRMLDGFAAASASRIPDRSRRRPTPVVQAPEVRLR
jgi:AcrR family transcriptional regulator